MTEDHNLTAEHNIAWYRTRLALFIGGSIVIATILVMISLALYVSSGAAQLDLSRPGYKSVQSKVDPNDSFKSFPSTGDVDSATIEQFQKLFNEQVKQVTSVDAFNPGVLEDQALGIDAPAVTE